MGWEQSSGTTVILFVHRDEEGHMRFLVHPDLHSIVQREDSMYIRSLLQDFRERAKQDPASLFEQLCSLAVGRGPQNRNRHQGAPRAPLPILSVSGTLTKRGGPIPGHSAAADEGPSAPSALSKDLTGSGATPPPSSWAEKATRTGTIRTALTG